ncbi:Beta-scruin like protein [Argiope bruennichi]|uniref:Beta-scruin like protein n=1 Tax=Argiope bruennichi TaxID=94029 RepID=A0A8T0FP32_ARGBR|nr:Beta-scruin like protein [Argiope bruennichi]
MRTLNKLPIELGTIIKVDNVDASSSSDFTSQSDLAAEWKSTTEIKKETKSYSRLPREFDPNLGLLPYLPPLEAPYQTKMNQAWNIAPYFLDILPQSSCCDLNDCILLLGGLNPFKPDDFVLSSSIFEFHMSSQTWRYYGSMMEPRCCHASCFDGSYLYVTGGYSALKRKDGEMVAIPSTDRLDIRTTLWRRCADMKTARASHAMVAVGKYLYVFGGRNSFGSITASVEMYDTEEDFWVEITRLPRPTMGLSATCVNNDIWILGGITEDKGKIVISDVYSFIPSNKSWQVQTPLPGPHAFASCVSSGNAIWVVAGSHSSETELVSCSCIWHLKLRSRQVKWKMAASLSTPLHSSCTVLCGKDLYVFGGIQSKEKKVMDTVEIFNIESGILRRGVNLPAAITGSSAIFLDQTISGTKVKKRVKSLICRNELAPKLDKLIQTHILPFIGPTTSEEHQEKFHSKLENISETRAKSSENVLHSTLQKEHTMDQKHTDYEEQSSDSYSDVHESDVSKSSEEESPKFQAQDMYSSEQPGQLTAKVHLYVNKDSSLSCENKDESANHYLRRTAMRRSSSTDKSSDDYSDMRSELYRRNFQVKQMSTKNHECSQNITDFHRNLYVTTLEVPMDGKETCRKYHLNDLQPMKTEMVLENRKWKPIEICFSDSSSDTSWRASQPWQIKQVWEHCPGEFLVMEGERNGFERFCNKVINVFDGPVTWFRETVVLPNQKQYPYYHRVYPRVPTIDECYEKDAPCMYEANEQFKRDMKVDAAIVDILRKRKLECVRYEGHERHEKCKQIFDEYAEAELNYFIKYLLCVRDNIMVIDMQLCQENVSRKKS